jgi:phage portal protein BeeE
LFSLEASTLDNYKEARKAIYTDCVIPFFDRLIPKMNNWLMPPFGGTLDFDADSIPELVQDKGVQAQSLSTAWWLTPNERRGQMGLLPHTDPLMDTILFPQGLMPGVDLGMDNEDMSL